MKIKFESDYDLPLGKILNILLCVIIAKSVFQENGRYYPQVHLKDCFCEHEHENEDDSYVVCQNFTIRCVKLLDFLIHLLCKV